MRCISPLNARKNLSGDIVYNNKLHNATQAFQFECRRCLPCRLNLAREKAIRCLHEAKMHEDNIFLTLTYNDESLASDRLIYDHFKIFMDSLRTKAARDLKKEMDKALKPTGQKCSMKQARKLSYIPFMVTGEYGDETKRPHWHAIIFNYSPKDKKFLYTSDRGDKVYNSEEIAKLWNKGHIEFGSVTMESAGYVARYAAKKLAHGKDDEHNYHPIHKTSSRHAIGKTWLEKYWQTDCFNQGFILGPAPEHNKYSIPRYYWEWLEENHPKDFKVFKQMKDEKYLQKKDKIEADNTYERRESKDFIINQKANKLKRTI